MLSTRFVFLGVAVLGAMGILTALQRQIIYFPSVAGEQVLLERAAGLGLQPWRDDGGELVGWRTENAGTGSRRLVVFHGNAGFALDRNYYVHGFRALEQQWEVYLFEYPGYGAR